MFVGALNMLFQENVSRIITETNNQSVTPTFLNDVKFSNLAVYSVRKNIHRLKFTYAALTPLPY